MKQRLSRYGRREDTVDTVTLSQLVFNADKPVPESGKHYFVVYYCKADSDKPPRQAWTGKVRERRGGRERGTL